MKIESDYNMDLTEDEIRNDLRLLDAEPDEINVMIDSWKIKHKHHKSCLNMADYLNRQYHIFIESIRVDG